MLQTDVIRSDAVWLRRKGLQIPTGIGSCFLARKIVALLKIMEGVLHQALCGKRGEAPAYENDIRIFSGKLLLHFLNRNIERWTIPVIANPNQEAAGQSAFLPEGGEHITRFPVVNFRICVQISVGTALTPDHAAVPDVNMVVLKPDQTLPGAGCGIGIKGRTGSPFRNGGAAFGSRYTDNGDPGLLITETREPVFIPGS